MASEGDAPKLPPVPPIPEHVRERLAAARATEAAAAPVQDPAVIINDVIAHSSHPDGSTTLRTRPEVLSVMLRDAFTATSRSELQEGFQLAAQRLHRSDAFADFSLETLPAPGRNPLRAFDIHANLHESTLKAQTGVTRCSNGTVEWFIESKIANLFSSAETLTLKLTHRKHDFSVAEAAAGLRDRFGAAAEPKATGWSPLDFFPAYEVALSKPTLFDTNCGMSAVLRGETIDYTGKCGFSNLVQEGEVGIWTPSLRHTVSYLCSWRNLMPVRHPNKHFTCATAAPVVANADSSVKSSVVYRYRDDSRPMMAVPTSGRLIEFVGEVAGVGGDVQFAKLEGRTQAHTSYRRYLPDTGYCAPIHSREQYEMYKKAKNNPDHAFLHPDPAQRGLKPHPGASLVGVQKLGVLQGGEYTWADRLAGWMSPGITVALSSSIGMLRSYGADKYRRDGTRIMDRFFLGGPEMTGFDRFGIGPRASPVVGGNPAGDALGGDMSAFSALRVYLPPPLPSVRLANFGVRTELFACAGAVMPKASLSGLKDAASHLSASAGGAIVVPLMSHVSLQAQCVFTRHKQATDVNGTILALISLW